MPERPVGANGEGFEASIGILAHAWHHEKVCVGRLVQWVPVTPRFIRDGLPDVPECSIGTNGENFETSTGVLSHGGSCLNSCRGLAQRGPIGLYHGVPFPPCVFWLCMR